MPPFPFSDLNQTRERERAREREEEEKEGERERGGGGEEEGKKKHAGCCPSLRIFSFSSSTHARLPYCTEKAVVSGKNRFIFRAAGQSGMLLGTLVPFRRANDLSFK